MKIHELAHLSGVNPETIRMYRQKGLLHPARLANGYFDYSACNLYELMFVRKLRGANLGLETIASFYAEDGQAGALRNMKQEIRALEEAIRELEQRKKQLMSTLGHYVLFSNQPQQVQELTLCAGSHRQMPLLSPAFPPSVSSFSAIFCVIFRCFFVGKQLLTASSSVLY